MGKLAEAAGARKLTGAVCVTDANGVTTTYPDEAAAEAALPSGCKIEHRRGAFFLTDATEAPAAPTSPPKKKKRRSSSSDEG